MSAALSVCMPTWNGGDYVAEALDSVLAQTHGDFELLVVDDGSTDRTLDVVSSVKDPRLKLHRNPARLGIPGNWNRCLELAGSAYVKFLFQDDLLRPTALERLRRAMDAPSRPSLAFARREIRHVGPGFEDGPVLGAHYARYLEGFYAAAAPEVRGLDLIMDAVKGTRPVDTNVVGEPSFVLVRREAALAAGGFDTRLHQLPDWDLWLKLGRDAPLAFVDESLGVFRIHRGGQSFANFGRAGRHREALRLMRNLQRWYAKHLGPEARRWIRRRRRNATALWLKESLLAGLGRGD